MGVAALTSSVAGPVSRQKPAGAARGWDLLLSQMGYVAWTEREGDIHVLSQAGAVGDGERGGNAGVQIRAAADEEVGGFHTQLIQGNNVVGTNLQISKS